MTLEEHKALYRTLSKFDKDLSDYGVSTEERSTFFHQLDLDRAHELVAKLGYTELETKCIIESVESCREAQKGKNPFIYVADNIYELMLLLTRFWVEQPAYIYRGHSNSHWELIPSWYRSRVVRDIQLYNTAMNARYRRSENKQIGRNLNLSPLEREAIVQHYGSGTLLIDTTMSIRIAAFFATFELGESRGDVGRIYILNTDRLEEHGILLLRASQLPYEFTRIHTTKACFLQGWARGEDFNHGDYLQRLSDSEAPQFVSFTGQVGLTDPNMYFLEWNYCEAGNDVWEFDFKQTGETFTDPYWAVSQHELDY